MIRKEVEPKRVLPGVVLTPGSDLFPNSERETEVYLREMEVYLREMEVYLREMELYLRETEVKLLGPSTTSG